jgi:hypothetical protein
VREAPDMPEEPLPGELPNRPAVPAGERHLRRLAWSESLPAGKELVSPSGRYALRYDPRGMPEVIDRATRQVAWRTGESADVPAAGELVFGDAVEVRLHDGGTWRSSLAAEGAHFLVVTDGGELELADERGMSLYNSRLGYVGWLEQDNTLLT